MSKFLFFWQNFSVFKQKNVKIEKKVNIFQFSSKKIVKIQEKGKNLVSRSKWLKFWFFRLKFSVYKQINVKIAKKVKYF